MTDTGPDSATGRGIDKWLEPGKTNIQLIYILYLVGFIIPVTPIIGIVFAYLNRDRTDGWLSTHYDWAIRTFWMGLAFAICSISLLFFVIGFVIIVANAVWVIVRAVVGLQLAAREQPILHPHSLWI